MEQIRAAAAAWVRAGVRESLHVSCRPPDDTTGPLHACMPAMPHRHSWKAEFRAILVLALPQLHPRRCSAGNAGHRSSLPGPSGHHLPGGRIPRQHLHQHHVVSTLTRAHTHSAGPRCSTSSGLLQSSHFTSHAPLLGARLFLLGSSTALDTLASQAHGAGDHLALVTVTLTAAIVLTFMAILMIVSEEQGAGGAVVERRLEMGPLVWIGEGLSRRTGGCDRYF